MDPSEGAFVHPQAPLVLFDGTCGFCRRSIEIAGGVRFRARIDARAFQEVDLVIHNLSVEKCAEALHVVDKAGRVHVAGQAVATILRASRFPWPLVGRLMTAPGIRWLVDRAYFLVANNRHRIPLPPRRPG